MYRMGKEEIEAVTKVLESGNLFKINGGTDQFIKRFEAGLREKTGAKYAVTMTSGKAALISGLIGMGIGPGDEVIVPGYTYIATAMAVTAVGAIPVIADINETMTLDPKSFEEHISAHTKAVIPVHIQGFASDMDEICRIAKEHNIFVLEDSCQADGGWYKGRRLGSIGDAGAFSFNYYKVITAGEGGALLTSNRQIFERGLIYHDSSAICFFGDQMDGIQEPSFCGTEYRISEVTGAILYAQLQKLDDILADLKTNWNAAAEVYGDPASGLRLAPANDPDGGCKTTVALTFDTAEQAQKFASVAGGGIPINTGKHVYINWDCFLNKRGAVNPAFDPFLFPANQGLNMNYTPDAAVQTLDILSRTVYIGVNPNASAEATRSAAEKAVAAWKAAK